MKTRAFIIALAASATLWCSTAIADVPPGPALGTSRPAPTATMSVGTLTVEKYGSGDPAVILIPGLACGSWVWDGTIRALQSKHTVYAVTLAGFGGTAPATGQMLDKADASIQQLIDSERLVKPIIVGHSLGGFLAIRFAEEHSPELSRVAAVDGLPVFPTMAQMTPEQRMANAKQLFEPLRTQTPEQFAAGEASFVSGLVSDPKMATQVSTLAAKSDANATAEYGEEMFAADLRPALGSIHVPMLEVVPVPKDLPPGFPDYMRSMTPEELSPSFISYYTALFPGATTVQLVPILYARHFAMLDEPDAFYEALTSFIDAK
jgi:pimeloyl-ACP methyl ester carboxylesterase